MVTFHPEVKVSFFFPLVLADQPFEIEKKKKGIQRINLPAVQPSWDGKLRFRSSRSFLHPPLVISDFDQMTLSQFFAPCEHPWKREFSPCRGKVSEVPVGLSEQHSGRKRGGNEDLCAKEVRDEDGAE